MLAFLLLENSDIGKFTWSGALGPALLHFHAEHPGATADLDDEGCAAKLSPIWTAAVVAQVTLPGPLGGNVLCLDWAIGFWLSATAETN